MSILVKSLESALDASDDRARLAPAKINLALHVKGRRADGYHDLETVSVFADYGDVVSVQRLDRDASPTLSIDGPFAGGLTDGNGAHDNLVVRAARAIAERARGAPTAALSLTKRLPVAAGLGGGSSDAAATLHLLNRLWKLRLKTDHLAAIGAQLGADVPMCVHGRPVIATGIGEVIRPVGLPALPIVLAFPGGGLPTASVFAALDDDARDGLPDLPPSLSSVLDVVFWLRKTRNDLARPAAAVSSLAGAAAKALHRDPDCLFARMSGSGTSAFGIFVELRHAERAADRIKSSHPDWWVIATMTGASPA